jgi:hypothetical protein
MSVEKQNKRKELVKKLRKAMNRLLAPPEQKTPSLILVPVRPQKRF